MIQSDQQPSVQSIGSKTGGQLENDLAGRLFVLLGVFQEYQSSAIALVRLRTAVVRDPHLASVLRPSLADMHKANQALRKEVIQMQHAIAAQMSHNPGQADGDEC